VTRADGELRRLTRAFLDERESFWGFHEGFLARWTRLPPNALSATEHSGWNEIYAWILTAIPDPVSHEDGARGVIGEAELRNRLRHHPLMTTPR
jgi:hypothetical protein